MRLGRLRGENFHSFESFDLDLNTRGLIAVVGENGAGKSTNFWRGRVGPLRQSAWPRSYGGETRRRTHRRVLLGRA